LKKKLMKRTFTLLSFFIVNICFGQGVWTNKADCLGNARYRAISFEINGKCYMGMGSLIGNVSQKDLWEYNILTNTWTQKADLIGPTRANATASSANGYGYVGLGYNGAFLKDWYQFDPIGNSWLSKASFPGLPRYGAGAFSIQNMIYAGGGLDSASNPKSDFYVYDPVADVWTAKASLNTAVACMAVFTIGQKGYFVTGVINGTVSSVKVNQEYDVANNSWTVKAFYPPGNTFSAIGFATENYGYVGTGFTGSLTDVMYRYDPIGDSWTQETSWPTGSRQWAVSCVSGNRVFVGTGNSTGGQIYNDWWEFTSIFTGTNEIKTLTSFTAVFNKELQEITLKNLIEGSQIYIYDLHGKMVYSIVANSQNMSIPWSNNGIYLISGNKEINSVKKVVCLN
jgi:hypothetical protein